MGMEEELKRNLTLREQETSLIFRLGQTAWKLYLCPCQSLQQLMIQLGMIICVLMEWETIGSNLTILLIRIVRAFFHFSSYMMTILVEFSMVLFGCTLQVPKDLNGNILMSWQSA